MTVQTRATTLRDLSTNFPGALVRGLAGLLLASTLVATAQAATPIVSFSAYREYHDVAGQLIVPSETMILATQARFIEIFEKRLAESGDTAQIADVAYKKTKIDEWVSDAVLANGLYLDVLAESSAVEAESRIVAIQNALRWTYLLEIEPPDFTLDEGMASKGIAPSVASLLEAEGMTVLYFTKAGGPDYIAECAAAGVPIPPPMFAEPWINRGSFDGSEFSAADLDPELWLYQSANPEGICLALPRYNAANQAELLGIICLGTASSKACFWDNSANEPPLPRNVAVSIENFVGGSDLVANDQGECSDCHSGENSFIIHPEVAAFAAIPEAFPPAVPAPAQPSVTSLSQPTDWYEPIVDPSWPQNPGPTNLLDAVASPGDCTSCHRAEGSGRFPEVSLALPGYCDTVLAGTTGTDGRRPGSPGVASWDDVNAVFNTMPAYQQANGDLFKAHIGALEDACGEAPSSGIEVITALPADDTSVVSPPIVIDPLYGCASHVGVRGAVLDAVVSIFVNGVLATSGVSRDPDQRIFSLPDPLVAGDVVTATQKVGGTASATSDAVTVRDHTADFPLGLPAPRIDPTLVHECGNLIAVRHVPGATVTTWVNGAFEVSGPRGSAWSGIYPGKTPFVVGDKFMAEIALCDDTSPVSEIVTAVAAPSPLRVPEFDPAVLYEGQELVRLRNLENSARIQVQEMVAGVLRQFDTAVSWSGNIDVATPLGRPLETTDSLMADVDLCEYGYSLPTPDGADCDEIPAPEMRRPVAGNNYIVVTEALPGARLRVYDSLWNEIGDGSGTTIGLSRVIVADEQLRLSQSLAGCTGQVVYFATAATTAMKLAQPGDEDSEPDAEPDAETSSAVESAVLRVSVAGSTEGSIDVCFYDGDAGELIGCDFGVENGALASVPWTGLEGATTYRWYAVGTDVLLQSVRSATFEFTTGPATTGVPLGPGATALLFLGLLATGAAVQWRRRN